MTKRDQEHVPFTTVLVFLAIIIATVAAISFITTFIMVYIFHYNTIHFLIQVQKLIHPPPTLIFSFSSLHCFVFFGQLCYLTFARIVR